MSPRASDVPHLPNVKEHSARLGRTNINQLKRKQLHDEDDEIALFQRVRVRTLTLPNPVPEVRPILEHQQTMLQQQQGQIPGQASSPQIGQYSVQPPIGVSHVQILEHQIRSKYPQATSQQVMRILSYQLAKIDERALYGTGPGALLAPRMQAQMLRQQEESQKRHQQAQQDAYNAVRKGRNEGQGSGSVDAGHGHVRLDDDDDDIYLRPRE
jgi:hypothetical protein